MSLAEEIPAFHASGNSDSYFLSYAGKNIPRVIYRKFAKSLSMCPDAATRESFINEFCKSLDDLKVDGDWQKMKFFLPDYIRNALRENEAGKLEETFATKRRRRNEKLLEVYPHCSDEFSTRIDFLDAMFGSERHPLILPSTRIFTLGSCFARNIAGFLTSAGFTVEHYDQVEDLNSPFSNAKMLAVCTAPVAERNAYIEQWFRFLYPTEDGIDLKALTERETVRFDHMLSFLKSAEFLIITCGNVLDYFIAANTGVASREIGPPNVAPKFLTLAQSESVEVRAKLTTRLKKAGAEFRLGTYQEVVNALESLYTSIRSLNPHAPLLFTLSPVPIGNAFGLTHKRKIGAVEIDCISKGLLRGALSELMDRHVTDDKLFYFPSFEIVRWIAPCMDAAVMGREDASSRHVSDHVIHGVYEYFLHKFTA